MADQYRILLVDDEPSVVKTVGKRLEIEGFDVVVAFDGEEALAKARQAKPDLIILDLMLPKLDGYHVCAALRKDPQHQKTPIVILTARMDKQDEQMAMSCGANAYIRKPFRGEEMLGKIRSLLVESQL